MQYFKSLCRVVVLAAALMCVSHVSAENFVDGETEGTTESVANGIAPSKKESAVKPYLTTDLTNIYLWRGQRLAGVSIQPVMGLKWKGLNFFLWGNAQLSPQENPEKYEIDILLKYQLTPRLNVALKDVYTNARGKGIFTYGRIGHASHGVEVVLNYDWKYFITEWTTTVFGHDGLNHKGDDHIVHIFWQ